MTLTEITESIDCHEVVTVDRDALGILIAVAIDHQYIQADSQPEVVNQRVCDAIDCCRESFGSSPRVE